MVYSSQICEACLPDAPPASNQETKKFLQESKGWILSNDVDFKQLKKIYKTKDFVDSQRFANLVTELAESEGHHPSILIEYGKVTIRWWSQKINSIHRNDLIMSAKTDKLYDQLS